MRQWDLTDPRHNCRNSSCLHCSSLPAIQVGEYSKTDEAQDEHMAHIRISNNH